MNLRQPASMFVSVSDCDSLHEIQINILIIKLQLLTTTLMRKYLHRIFSLHQQPTDSLPSIRHNLLLSSQHYFTNARTTRPSDFTRSAPLPK